MEHVVTALQVDGKAVVAEDRTRVGDRVISLAGLDGRTDRKIASAADRGSGVVRDGIGKGADHFDAIAGEPADQTAVDDGGRGDRVPAVGGVDLDGVSLDPGSIERSTGDLGSGVIADRAAAGSHSVGHVPAAHRAQAADDSVVCEIDGAVRVHAIAIAHRRDGVPASSDRAAIHDRGNVRGADTVDIDAGAVEACDHSASLVRD